MTRNSKHCFKKKKKVRAVKPQKALSVKITSNHLSARTHSISSANPQ